MEHFKISALLEADALCHHILLLRVRNRGMGAEAITRATRVDIANVVPIHLDVMHGTLSRLRCCVGNPETLQAFMAVVSPNLVRINDEGGLPETDLIKVYEHFHRLVRRELGMPPLTLLDDPHQYFPIYLDCNEKPNPEDPAAN